MSQTQDPLPTRTVGRRVAARGDLASAAKFLDLVIRLRAGKPFIPFGVHRFHSFEESQAWSLRMVARRSKRAPRA